MNVILKKYELPEIITIHYYLKENMKKIKPSFNRVPKMILA